MAGADGAELALNGSFGLTDGEIDARLTLSGAPATGGAESTRPQIIILLKGPFDAPTRSLDVSSLASWLALRAVEQQSKKLDVLESRESAAVPITPDNPAPDAKPPPQAAPSPDARPRARSRPPKPPPKVPSAELAQPPVERTLPQLLFGVH